ncbi:Hypothetical Protein FCC1311_093972 [Hondaea fermentalgiana]|uniref:Uncharacterized protein n=1 Tax=Hondaea fermentalgiana TaxID=2315210 RepID=A0A2R5GWX2_9STRA|nr:Hypothetical Protein FCC1311_093972 [Hondaea fermentalgiana]|eukprot:GBG33173.1 Hypothetical Protein FCC1311_093972 [Hondaea fermentalgiana]
MGRGLRRLQRQATKTSTTGMPSLLRASILSSWWCWPVQYNVKTFFTQRRDTCASWPVLVSALGEDGRGEDGLEDGLADERPSGGRPHGMLYYVLKRKIEVKTEDEEFDGDEGKIETCGGGGAANEDRIKAAIRNEEAS